MSAAHSTASSQVISLTKMLVKQIAGTDDRTLLYSTIDKLTALPNHKGRTPSEEDSRAQSAFDRLEDEMHGHPDLRALQSLRIRLMSAGSTGTNTAPFAHKGALMELFYKLHHVRAPIVPEVIAKDRSADISVAGPQAAPAAAPRSAIQPKIPAPATTTTSVGSIGSSLRHNTSATVGTTSSQPAAEVSTAPSSYGPTVPTAAKVSLTAEYITAAEIGQMNAVDERALIKDILYVLQGINGQYIHFDDKDVCVFAVPIDSADGPIFIDALSATIALDICEAGQLYRKIRHFFDHDEMPGETTHRVVKVSGLVRQAFIAGIQAEMDEYYRQLAVLDAELRSEVDREHAYSKWSLLRLQSWLSGARALLKQLCVLLDSTYGAIGGALLSNLFSHYTSTLPDMQAIVGRVLQRSSQPFYAMLKDWICTGELKSGAFATLKSVEEREVPINELALSAELFIGIDTTVPLGDMWQGKFFLLPEQAPSFFSPEVIKAIIETGKAVHYIRNVCDENDWILHNINRAMEIAVQSGIVWPSGSSTASRLSDYTATVVISDKVRAIADKEARDHLVLQELMGPDASGGRQVEATLAVLQPLINSRLLDLLLHQHQLSAHLRAIQRYVLLTQGDFVSILISSICDELQKPAASTAIARHSLEGFVETAIRASNAQFEEKEVLRRLHVKILKPSPGDIGWDVFLLNYDLPQPLLVLMSKSSQDGYSALFHFLWRIKRVEFALSKTWSSNMTAFHALRSLRHAGLNGILHMCHLLRTDMTNFVSNLMSYLNFDVLAPAWQTFADGTAGVRSLDDLLHLHDAYIATMLDRSLMSDRTKLISEPLRQLLGDALRFCALQASILDEAQEQVSTRKQVEQEIAQRASDGQWGVPAGVEDMDALDDRIAAAVNTIVAMYGPRIASVARDYRSRLSSLLRTMEAAAFTDGLEELRTLVLRFDYNEYYGNHATSST